MDLAAPLALIAPRWKKSGGNGRRPMLNKGQDSVKTCSGYGNVALRQRAALTGRQC
jgi:hypothetical protein